MDEILIEEFQREGVAVITNVLSEEEVAIMRSEYHKTLSEDYGVDADNLEATKHNLEKLSSTKGSGGILDLFYHDWKLRLNEDERVVSIMQQLWYATYANSDQRSAFNHPYGDFDSSQAYMYIDRVCFRLPDHLIQQESGSKKKKLLQRSLTPHLDCCPHNMHTGRKWRPIQAFISLSDTLEPNHGGFEACKGLHLDFESWSLRRKPSANQETAPCVGQFTPIRPKEDVDVISKMEHVPCRAGDMICWDYRIPHANSLYNYSLTPREVIYIGLLPAIPLNKAYAEDQLQRYQNDSLPVDQWHSSHMTQPCNHNFSVLGRKLMAMDPWVSDSIAAEAVIAVVDSEETEKK